MTILSIVIGLVFVLLLLSLLATTIMELIASFFHLRGRNLLEALRNMLARSDASETILNDFKSNSLYRQLAQRYGRNGNSHQPPSYITADTFQSILFDIILKGEGLDKLQAQINELPDDDLRNVLNQLLRDADYQLEGFKTHIEGWYNNVMDRASGWYKRYTQKILIGVGMVIAVVFNADTLGIYSQLKADPEKLQTIVALAEQFAENGDGTVYRSNTQDFAANAEALNALLADQISAVSSPLGLGWDADDLNFAQYTTYDWVTKILGFFVTALGISLGAPFWFDLLRKIVNIRSSGSKP